MRRIIRDVEKDLWEEEIGLPGLYGCRTAPEGYAQRCKTSKWIEARYGPITVYAPVELES
jgi:hypothetical protein